MMRAIPTVVLIAAGLLCGHSAPAQPPAPAGPALWKSIKIQKPAPIDRSSIEGQGKLPLIIIADLGLNETAYADFAKRHAERFTTHTLVLPGAVKESKGPSLDRGQVRDPEWLVNAVDAVRDYAKDHKLEKPLVLGQGVGGTVAYMLAIREPELATGYVIINALPAPSIGAPGRIPAKDQRSTEVDKLERSNIVGMSQSTWLKRIRSLVPLQTTDPKRAEALIAMLATAPIGAVRRYTLEPLYLDLREDLDGATTPMLVYATLPDWVGERDKAMLRASFQNVAFNRPAVRLEILDGARQWAILDDPARFDPPLLTFLGIAPDAAPATPQAPATDPIKPDSSSESEKK
ncbi:MAG: alpha/beta fold hydrolase [Phycisphaerales bacterium]